MISTKVRWLLGCAAFFLPTAVVMAGLRLDHSPYNHHPLYKAVIPYVVFGSVLIAALVPGSLILSSRLPLPRRVLFTALAIVALGIQVFLAFSWVLMSWH